MAEALTACPFCGGKAIWIRDPEDCCEIRGVYCLGCKALVKWNIEAKKTDTFGQTMDAWLAKWNRRANDDR